MTTSTTRTVNGTVALNAARDGLLTVEANSYSLTVPPLADPAGPDCYPGYTLTLSWPLPDGGRESVEVPGWKVGVYMKGPNRRDNGAWIGHGWRWIVDDGDGAFCGTPTVRAEGQTVRLLSNVGAYADAVLFDLGPDGEDGADELAELLAEAIREDVECIDVDAAPDEDVYAALCKRRPAHSVDAGGRTIDLYAGDDAGRPVFCYSDDAGQTVYEDDAQGCLNDAAVMVRELMEEEISRVECELTSDPTTLHALTRRAIRTP